MKKLTKSTAAKLRLARFLILVAVGLIVWAGAAAYSSSRVDYDELTRQATTRVFKVIIQTPFGYGGGTGFLVDAGLYGKIILTNRHICEALPNQGQAIVLQQLKKTYSTHVRRMSKTSDLCLLEVPQGVVDSADAYTIGEPPKPGDHVLVFGHPFLGPLVMNHGPYLNTMKLIGEPGDGFDGVLAGKLDFPIRPGNSGSPLVNEKGKVIGIVFAMEGEFGLFIPLGSIRRFLDGEE